MDDAERPPAFVVPHTARHRTSVLVNACGEDGAHADARATSDAAALQQARRLLATYGAENARLRARLRASQCQELCYQRALDVAAAARAGDGEDDGAAAAVRQMQLRVCELQGKLRAYEEALCHAQQPQKPPQQGQVTDDASLREVLRQCLSKADYLVKVCNACAHCRDTPHGLAAHCPRTRVECTRRCLRAAARGSDGDEAATSCGGEDDDVGALALALRDELLYCETMTVRLAAAQLLDAEDAPACGGGGDARGKRAAHIDGYNSIDKRHGRSDDDAAMSHNLAFHDLSNEAIAKMPPSEALLKHLENAQLAHRVCVAKAMKAGEEPVDKCALTWGEVLQRYNQWAEYRPPFQDADAQARYTKFWTKKRQAADDAKNL